MQEAVVIQLTDHLIPDRTKGTHRREHPAEVILITTITPPERLGDHLQTQEVQELLDLLPAQDLRELQDLQEGLQDPAEDEEINSIKFSIDEKINFCLHCHDYHGSGGSKYY